MTVKKALKKPLAKPAPLSDKKTGEHPEPVADLSLSPIVDKRTYDRFIKVIALRVYSEFEKTMKSAGIEKPELILVGFDLNRASSDLDSRMVDYIALNARIILEKAFVDRNDYAAKNMPRVMHQMEEDGAHDVAGYVEGKVRQDLMMEIRAIAMQHIPEAERFGYRNTLKVL